jgi:heme A synthase
MGYMVSGLVTLILALFSHATYSSTCRLGAFLFILFLCFCAVLGLSLAVSLLKSSIDLYGSENGEIIEYSLFGASGLLFLEFIFGSWYFSSVKDFEIEKENMNLLTRSH